MTFIFKESPFLAIMHSIEIKGRMQHSKNKHLQQLLMKTVNLEVNLHCSFAINAYFKHFNKF